MLMLDRLRVSLTKNGYMKLADLLKRHPRWEVLDHVYGSYPGIKIARSQAANIMGEDRDGEIPEHWDEIRADGNAAIEAFVFVAVVMSHVDLIDLLKSSSQGAMKGYIERGKVGQKAYTNLVYALASVGACDYIRGAESVNFDLRTVVYALRESGEAVRSLIGSKLRRCGWRDKDRHPLGTEFFEECEAAGIHTVFGLEPREFKAWLQNRSRIKPPTEATPIGRPR